MTSASSGTGKKEQRRHARLATSQTAQIRFGEGEAIPAEIRDYCPTGLYVAFPGERTPDAAIPVLVGDSVQVAFEEGGSGVLRCEGRVARISPGGVGIFTAALPEDIVQALRAASGHRTRSGSNRAGSGLSPQQSQALQLECTSQFRSFLDTVMQDFFQRAVERLAEAGQDEPSFLERSRYDYGVQELTQLRSRIEEAFFNAIRDRIQHVGAIMDPSSEGAAANKLSLVDEAEFEDWLSLSAVIKQIEVGIASPLGEFEQRYSRLIGMPVDRKNNPLGPEMIGHAFQDAIQILDFSNPMRAVLYKALGQAVSNQSLALYQQLNQTLVSLQPLPLPEPGRDKAESKPAPAEARSAEGDKTGADLAELADTLNALYKQDQSGAPQTPESAEYSLDRILATLNQSQRRAASDNAPVTSAAQSSRQMGASPGHSATARPEVLQMVSRLQQTARQMSGRDEAALRPVAAPVGAGTALTEASLRELQLALDSLPLVNQAAAGMPSSLTDQIDAHIAASGGSARRIAPGQRLILDTTSDLFARARADFVPSSDVELLVKRLERPLLKLALQDAHFPNQPDHPARQVLNLIEQYAVAADDQGKFFDARLQRFLYLLVDRVCSRADVEPGIFETVRDSLEKVLLPILQIRRTRVARLQEASEGRERIRSARTRVNASLEQRLAGREVPAMLLRLLDAGWRQYLVLLEMRQGAQGESWDAGLAVLDRLFAWFSPADADAPRTSEAAQALLNEVERTLATVNVDAKLLAAFMDELGDRLADASARPAAGAAMVLVPPGRLAPPQDEGSEAQAHRRLAAHLRVGDWWDFSLDGSRVPMQLIWVSQPPLSCAFSNRSATGRTDLTLAELSRRMQGGLVKPGKDLDMPLVERSENALFDETYQRLVHQVMHDPVTGLLNRKGFVQHLTQLAMPDQADKTHAIGIIEFDQLRLIYNTCGVEAAEGLARGLANEIRAQIGPDAALATFRDDTLAVLLPNCSRADGFQAIDSLLREMKDYHFQHGQHSYSIGFNIGLTEYVPTRFNAVEAIRHADSACITAKSMGRNRMQVYEQASPQLQSQESLMDWAGRIDSFLSGNGLYLRCQQVRPIDADASLLPYYEILLGINSEAGLEISPMHFVPAVESLQRSHELDIWVIRNVFEWIRAHPSTFEPLGGFAINLSANSLSSPEVMNYLQQVLPGSNIPTHKIAFEITETAAIESYGAAQDFIREIRRYGFKFSLDDFGSGFTSYAHLKNLRTDTLKIDGSFVKDMLQNPDDYAMVKSMNDIGHSLGLITVAEYVESPLILDALREIGVDYAQGYAIHKPCRIDELLSAQAPVLRK